MHYVESQSCAALRLLGGMHGVYYQALREVLVRVQFVDPLAGIQGGFYMHFVEFQTGHAVASQG